MPKASSSSRKTSKHQVDHKGSCKADNGLASDGKRADRLPIARISALSSRINVFKLELNETLNAIIETPYKKYLFWAILVIASLPITLNKIESLDAWFHIHYGRVMWETWSAPDLSQSYFMPIMQNVVDFRFTFLGDVCLYLIHALGGDIGLQMFKIGCVLFAIYLLLSINRFKYTGWTLLILIFFVLGTYQKHLIRNSLFGLPFTVFSLWLFIQVRFKDREKLIWIYPLLIGVWGITHGSYLFGFSLMVLLFLGDVIDSFRKLNPGRPRYLWTYLIVVAISFGAIYVKNPLTQNMLIDPIRNLMASAQSKLSCELTAPAFAFNPPEQQATKPQPPAPSMASNARETGIFGLIKQGLNSTVFKSDPEVLSSDFTSPFDNLRSTAVLASLAFGIIAAIALSFARPCRCSIVFPFVAVTILGLGYFRTVGDITVVSAWTLLTLTAGYDDFFPRLKERMYCASRSPAPWLIAFLWMIGVSVVTLTGNASAIIGGSPLHIAGFGRFHTFDDSTYDYVLQKFKDKRVFTTISTGSYALYHWYPNKKVFIDGFFAPHDPQEYRDSLRILRRTEDPDILYRKYQIEVALLENTRDNFARSLRDSENWYPVAIGLGTTVFQYLPDAPADDFTPLVLFDIYQVSHLPETNRYLVATEFYRTALSFYSKGRIKDGFDFMQKYSSLYEDLRAHLPSTLRDFPDQIVSAYKSFEQLYGRVNDKGIRYDYLHTVAITERNPKDIAEYGMKLAELYPHNMELNLKLAGTLMENGKFDEALIVLGHMEADTSKEHSQEFKSSLASLYTQIGSYWEAKGDPVKAYQCYAGSHHLDADAIGKTTLYQKGTELYMSLNKAGKVTGSLEVVKSMLNDFQEDGPLLHNFAWFLLSNSTASPVSPEVPLEYALKAVAIMEKDRDQRLYAAYRTVSEAYLQMGNTEKALDYAGKALALAPDESQAQIRKRIAELTK